MLKIRLIKSVLGGLKDVTAVIFGNFIGANVALKNNKDSEEGGKGNVDYTRLSTMLIVIGLIIMFVFKLITIDDLVQIVKAIKISE